ncbi:hypothetical protein WJX73_005846 [Symbiochloris irregularis]|uniref:Uncharacterized protein n=1 Tax=Symbiochloris irregularis TaxID=706552 RepID=A0AAW1NJY4_9CHLO
MTGPHIPREAAAPPQDTQVGAGQAVLPLPMPQPGLPCECGPATTPNVTPVERDADEGWPSLGAPPRALE